VRERRIGTAAHRSREPEIEHLHAAIRRDLDVAWLEIAVHDTALVRGFEGIDDLRGDRRDLADREARCDGG
jgi:hypothetical protein